MKRRLVVSANVGNSSSRESPAIVGVARHGVFANDVCPGFSHLKKRGKA